MRMYAIKKRNGRLGEWFWCIHHRRRDAIAEFIHDTGKDWNHWRRQGFICVRVEVAEIQP